MKKYTKPEMKVILLQHKSQLLAGSGSTMLMNNRVAEIEDPEYNQL